MNKGIILSGISMAIVSFTHCSLAAEARELFPGFSTVQMQTIANLNTHRSQLESRIASALSLGQLTAQQAADLRSQLAQGSAQQSQFLTDNILNVQEIQSLISTLNNTESTLQSHINSYQSTQAALLASASNPAFAAPANAIAGNQMFAWKNRRMQEMLNLQSSLSAKIEAGKLNRRLSQREYTSLKAELDKVSARIQTLNNQSRFNRGQTNSIISSLYNLEDKINKELRDRERDYASRNGRRYW